MASVTILDQTYTLPAIGTERFRPYRSRYRHSNRLSRRGCARSPACWA